MTAPEPTYVTLTLTMQQAAYLKAAVISARSRAARLGHVDQAETWNQLADLIQSGRNHPHVRSSRPTKVAAPLAVGSNPRPLSQWI